MNKFASLLAAPLCVVAMSLPAAAEKLSLGELLVDQNRQNTASADFTQINDDGTISTGKLFLKRPGRMRFEYNPPEKTLVLASAGAVAIFDPKTNQGPESYPLNRTPLSIILARNVDLARANMVVGHGYDGTATTVTAQDPEHPEYGNIQLVFTGAPVQLRQWVINDDAENSTTVVLGAMQSGQGLSDTLFNIQLATQRPIR